MALVKPLDGQRRKSCTEVPVDEWSGHTRFKKLCNGYRPASESGAEPNGVVTAFYVAFRSAAIAALNIRRGTVISFSCLGLRLFSRGSMRPGRAPTTAHTPCA